jgi:hypothetical protein
MKYRCACDGSPLQMNVGVVHRDGSRWDRFYTRLRELTGS